MASKIRIYRSTGATAPASLEYGELAVTVEQGTAGTSANKAGRLFIGNPSGNPVEIGGEYTYKLLDHTHGELINSSAVIVDSGGQINGWNVAGVVTATRTDITDLVTQNLNVTGVSTFVAGINLNGNVVIGDNALDTLTVNATAGFNTHVDINDNLIVTGITTINGNTVIGGTLDVDGQAIFDDITVSAASTFNGPITQTTGEATFASAKINDLTDGRVVFVNSGGSLVDSVNFTFASDILSVYGLIDANTVDGETLRGAVGVITTLSTNDFVGYAVTVGTQLTIGGGGTRYTFPSADGVINQVLVTDGSGNLTFQDVSSSMTISAGYASTDSVSLLTETFTIAATDNETKTTLSDNTITVGLATDVIVGGGLTVTNDLLVLGNLTVEGTETVINVERLDVQDKTIGVASTSTASNSTANGGGFFVHGGTDGDKTIFWSLSQSGFEVNQDWLPETNGTYDLGNSSRQWQNLFVDGLAELDDVNVSSAATVANLTVSNVAVLTNVDINSGTIDNTTVGAALSAAGTFTTLNAGTIVTGGRLDAGETTFSTLRVTGVSTVASLFFSTGTNTNGVGYFDANGQLQSTATPSAGIQTSNYILTTNASGVPSWTDTIDGGTF